MVYLQYLNRFDRNQQRIEERGNAFEELDDNFQSSYWHVLRQEKLVMDIFLVTEGIHVDHIFLSLFKIQSRSQNNDTTGHKECCGVTIRCNVLFWIDIPGTQLKSTDNSF